MTEKKFWQGTKCLITGGAGFLGTKLTNRLHDLGAETQVIRSDDFDLRNAERTHKAFRIRWGAEGPDIVFHLAATVGGIGATDKYAGRYFYDNAMMGLNIVESCRIFGVNKLVVAGSVCAYPKYGPPTMNEKNLWNGKPEDTNAPYGISKRAILAMQQAYYKQYNLKSAHILQANLYGPGDDFSDETSHVIPALIKRFWNAACNDEPEVVVWGTGTPTRDFLYAQDAVEAYILAAERTSIPDPINIGTGHATSIAFIAERIKEFVEYKGEIVYDKTRPDGQKHRQLQISRARDVLGWKPTTTIMDGLKETVAWYISK